MQKVIFNCNNKLAFSLFVQDHTVMYLSIIIPNILKHQSSGVCHEATVAPVLWNNKVA